MTTIDIDTSPLQAAREWRGTSLVAAALASGLTVRQAEALEAGDASEFDTLDAMIAAAVVYGATIGIGRDEALALLDRTAMRTGARVELPDAPTGSYAGEEALTRPADEFSGAVRERSARIDAREGSLAVDLPLAPMEQLPRRDLDVDPAAVALDADPIDLPHGPSPEQAVQASQEIHIGHHFDGLNAPWTHAEGTGELEAWAAASADDPFAATGSSSIARVRRRNGHPAFAKVGSAVHAGCERVLGTDKTDAASEWWHGVTERSSSIVRSGRERLRSSEHATLIVSIAAGAVLIALVVAIGGVIGGRSDGTPAASTSADQKVTSPIITTPGIGGAADDARAAGAAKPAPTATAGKKPAAKPAAKRAPVLAPSHVDVNVYNAGSRKGYAREVAARLRSAGYRIGEVTNSRGRFPTGTVLYPRGMEREAAALGRRVGISQLQPNAGSSRALVITVS